MYWVPIPRGASTIASPALPLGPVLTGPKNLRELKYLKFNKNLYNNIIIFIIPTKYR